MKKLATKLNLKDNIRICILNADKDIAKKIIKTRNGLEVDYFIDPRFLYKFFLIFISNPNEIDDLAHKAVHNLYDDGILWFAYPAPGKKPDSDKNLISRKDGWEALKRMGLIDVTNIIIDERWNGIRFRNSKHVRSRRAKANEE